MVRSEAIRSPAWSRCERSRRHDAELVGELALGTVERVLDEKLLREIIDVS
ncbi:hypothetical protein [Streptomyces anulatus]|uniref:hypothetical protein n=1 Tax=Streptomyces anulatus TaxID=1892 RepID=UPI00343CAAF7